MKLRDRAAFLLICASILTFLVIRYAAFIEVSGDLIYHFTLVDEIMRHGYIRETKDLGFMEYYPPISHWLAAIIGWIGGSGLVGMTVITIASLFLSYILILLLIDATSFWAMALAAVGFTALVSTASLVGWEVVVNFFYPQLVANVAYFAVLLWLARTKAGWKQAAFIVLAGAVTMWIQPLNAVHILAAGLVLLAFRTLECWRSKSGDLEAHAAIVVAATVASVAVIKLHPSLRAISVNANNDGYLEFGYSHILMVAATGGLLGLILLWRRLTGRTEYVDAVLGSAAVASACLVFMQFAALRFAHSGSPYAIKKHMFIALTMGVIAGVRIAAAYVGPVVRLRKASIVVAPVLAGLASAYVLGNSFTTPVAPVLRAMNYASYAADYGIPGFSPGNTVADAETQPAVVNQLVSLAAFRHPMNPHFYTWLFGADPKVGAKYAMVAHTPQVDRNCPERFAEAADYVIVDPACLRIYTPGDTLHFSTGGSGMRFIGSGWYPMEPWGTWSGSKGVIDLMLKPGSKGIYKLVADGQAFIGEGHTSQAVTVSVNGKDIATWKFDLSARDGERSAIIPPELARNGELKIAFTASGAASPSKVDKTSPDTRILGFGIKTISITEQ